MAEWARTSERDDHLQGVAHFFGNRPTERFGAIIRRGTDEVIATSRTRRWSLDQCNDQEKAYLGVNIEHLVRSEFYLDEGRQGMDFDVNGTDVDCKWSRNLGGWQIPNEAVGHICLLVHGDDITQQMAVGLIRITEDKLVGGNRDQKRTIQSPGGMNTIRWLIERGTALPENFLMSLRKEDRDAILEPRGGDARARELFRRCEGMIIYRHTIESIGQQLDEARRFRGETRAELLEHGFEVLNGHWLADRARAVEIGGITLTNSREWVCLRTDGSTPRRRAELEPVRIAESTAFRRSFKQELDAIRRDRRRKRKEAKAAETALKLGLELQDAIEDAADSTQALQAAERNAVSEAAQLPLQHP